MRLFYFALLAAARVTAPALAQAPTGTVKAIQPGLFEVAGPRVNEAVAAGVQKMAVVTDEGSHLIIVQSPWGYSYFGWPQPEAGGLYDRGRQARRRRDDRRLASTTPTRPTTRRRSRVSLGTRSRARCRTRHSPRVPAAESRASFAGWQPGTGRASGSHEPALT